MITTSKNTKESTSPNSTRKSLRGSLRNPNIFENLLEFLQSTRREDVEDDSTFGKPVHGTGENPSPRDIRKSGSSLTVGSSETLPTDIKTPRTPRIRTSIQGSTITLSTSSKDLGGSSPDLNNKKSFTDSILAFFKSPSPNADYSSDVITLSDWNLKDFDFIRTLGFGYFGKVKLAIHNPTDQLYAIKIITKKHILKSVTKLKEEIQIQKRLNSPFLLKLHKVFDADAKIYLVLDYLDGGDLRTLLTSQKNQIMDESTAKFYFVEMYLGLVDLHKAGIVHRDLKPENILLESKGHLKICDYGLSKKLKSGEKTYSFCGTPEYICRDLLLSAGHDISIDYWSLGICLFELLTGRTPFYDKDSSKMKKNILLGSFEIPGNLSTEVKDLILLLLEKDCEKRKKNWKKMESHPWLRDIDWKLARRKGLEPPIKIEKKKENFQEEETSPIPKPLSDMEKKIFIELSKLCDY